MSIWLTIRPPMIAMPSGRRNSEQVPVPNAMGAPPNSAPSSSSMSAEHQHAGVEDHINGVLLPSRSPCSAKSIIMMAFFFTMPISGTMPMIGMTFRSCPTAWSPASPRRSAAAAGNNGQRIAQLSSDAGAI